MSAYNTCPQCGGRKRANAKRCYNCFSSSGATRHTKVPCPVCGRPKLAKSEICRSCLWRREVPTKAGRTRKKIAALPPDWSRVDEAFLHQFIGLLLGEGCIRFHISRAGTCNLHLQIKLRADDLATLQHIHGILGGTLYVSPRSGDHSPEAMWAVYKQDHVEEILRAIRSLIVLPMRKTREIDLALDFADWRRAQKYHGIDREKAGEFYEQMQLLKELQLPDL